MLQHSRYPPKSALGVVARAVPQTLAIPFFVLVASYSYEFLPSELVKVAREHWKEGYFS